MNKKIIQVVPRDANAGPVNVAKDLCDGINSIGLSSQLFFIKESGARGELSGFVNLYRLVGKKDRVNLHSHGIIPDLFCFLLSFKSNVHWISTVHCDPHEDLKYLYPKSFKLICLLWLRLLKKADKVVYLTDYIFSKQKCTNGAVIINSRNIKLSLRNSNCLKKSPVAGFCGALIQRKNVKSLVEAFTKLPKNNLVIAGDGLLRGELDFVVKNEKSSNISFLGHLDNLEIFWKQIDVLILPSFAEGVPLVAIEALSRGIPLILMDLDNYKGVFTTKESLFIRQVSADSIGSALIEIYQSYDSYSKASTQAFLKRFNFEQWIHSYDEYYK